MSLLQDHIDEVNKSINVRQPIIDAAERAMYSNGYYYTRFFNDVLHTKGFDKAIGGRLVKFWKIKQRVPGKKGTLVFEPKDVLKLIQSCLPFYY
jgi:hypothetical protein